MLWVVHLVLAELCVLVGEANADPNREKKDKRCHSGRPGRKGPAPRKKGGLPTAALPLSSHTVFKKFKYVHRDGGYTSSLRL